MAPRAAPRRPAPLDEERIVDAAFAILDAEGLERLTIRRIAGRLRVQNPALYWHFESKQGIVDRMAERMLVEMASSARASKPAGWRAVLEAAARSFRRVMRGHRDGARVIAAADLSRSPMTDSMAETLELLVAAGLLERDALIGVIAVFDYTMGATFEEQEDPRRSPATARSPGRAPAAGGETAASALLARAIGSLGGDGDAVFEGGLELLLDGLGARLGRPRPRRSPRSPGDPRPARRPRSSSTIGGSRRRRRPAVRSSAADELAVRVRRRAAGRRRARRS
jgi:TetR/AcrR family transcriptional regulator, tetracycline repressor protein